MLIVTSLGHRGRREAFGLCAAAVTLVAAACAPPAAAPGAGDGGITIGGPATSSPAANRPVDVILGDTAGLAAKMTLTSFDSSAPSGDVTFRVKNVGTVEHEMLVIKTDTPFDKIPVTDSGDPPAPVATGADKIDEANNVAETGDPNLKPGEGRTFTAKGLAPGKYVLVCNIARHYGLGMRTPFTVTAGASTPTTTTAPPSHSVAVVLNDRAGLNGPMSVTASSPVAAAGDVTFTAVNTGTVDHELLVIKTDTPFDKIPIADSGDPPAPVATGADKIDEANNIAETGDPNLKPGESRAFTAKGLAPGKYVLVCNIARHYGLGMRTSFTVVAPPAAAAPPNTVAVALFDKAGLSGPMSVVPSSTTGAAGDVTYTVKNDGTIDHELLVIKTDRPFDQIPVTDSGDPPAPVATGADKIDEANNVAETGDPNLKPGETRTFTAKGLAAGKYVLVCNLARHYGLGMRAAFTVT